MAWAQSYNHLSDKTQVFRDQITVKQRELEPWNTKINKKQADINVATSERDSLNKKAEDAQNAYTQANELLENLRNEQQEKARAVVYCSVLHTEIALV
jgi:structural maintenance of chromosome 4